MGFDDWVSEQERARLDGASKRAADDQVRYANAARVVDALTAELRTVIPHLRAFPSVTVQEHRVEVASAVTGTVTVRPRRSSDFEAPAGQITAQCVPTGASRTAWAFEGMWLDEDGHLWFEVQVQGSGGLYDLASPALAPHLAQASARVQVPFRAADIGRWVTAGAKAAVELTIDGRPWSATGPNPEVAGAPFTVWQTTTRPPVIFQGSKWSSLPADLLRGDVTDMFVGFANYDAAATVARDVIFETVQAALQQGRHTL